MAVLTSSFLSVFQVTGGRKNKRKRDEEEEGAVGEDEVMDQSEEAVQLRRSKRQAYDVEDRPVKTVSGRTWKVRGGGIGRG